jgi:peptidyl-prolyl cis-trans isomerase B (cyclophilin B)
MQQLFRILALAILLTCPAWAQAQAQAQAVDGNPQVTIRTSKGDIRLELFADKAPLTVENFLQYARDGFYEGTIFHRVISHFMIQGGGLTPDLSKKPTRDAIRNEADNGLKNQRGTIAMARTTDPHSATAQFFINVEPNPSLDHTGTANSRQWGYCVFGRVTEGMDVVDDIRFVETSPRDVPLEPVTITSVEVD